MPENESQDGDRWTEEASELLDRLGWVKIADSNIDIEGSDGHSHGIDALFIYPDGSTHSDQGVFLEAKHYATSSFWPKKLQDWVSVLDGKIRMLRRSEEFYEEFPQVGDAVFQNGLLVIWFHDLENYNAFKSRFDESLRTVRTPRSRSGSTTRLFVLANDDILRLCSLVSKVKDLNDSLESHGDSKLKFVYPSSLSGNPAQELPVLNLEYIFSKFIVARSEEMDGRRPKTVYSVFYFGELDYQSFKRLKEALSDFNVLQSYTDLNIYYYYRSADFRAIIPDVEGLFQETGNVAFALHSMDRFSDVPSWMKDCNS